MNQRQHHPGNISDSIRLRYIIRLFLCFGALHCTQTSSSPSNEGPPLKKELNQRMLQRPIRLVETLLPEHVEHSPFSDANLEEPKKQNLFSVTRPPMGKPFKHRETSLSLLDINARRAFAAFIAVKPKTDYEILRTVLTEDPSTDLIVAELRLATPYPANPWDLRNKKKLMSGRFVKTKELVRIHHFTASSPDELSQHRLSLTTQEETHTLALFINDAEASIQKRERQFALGSLHIRKQSHDPLQRLRRLQNESVHPKAPTAAVGIAKHGQFLPIGRRSQNPTHANENNYEHRSALLLAAPTALKIPITLTSSDVFIFGTALHRLATPSAHAKLSITFKTQDQNYALWTESLETPNSPKQWRWKDTQIKLSGHLPNGTHQGTLHIQSEAMSDASQGAPLLLSHPTLVSAPLAETPQHNIIVFAVDTLRADRMSVYGYPKTTTPHLDRLAQESIVFDKAVSASNWTTAAFASMFTSEMPSVHRVVHRARRIPQSAKTLTEYIAESGRITHAILYKAYLYDMGFEQGFDRWFNAPRTDINGEDNWRLAQRWLDRYGQFPFYLFFHLNDPHQPFNQPSGFIDPFVSPEVQTELGIDLPITVGLDNKVLGCARCSIKANGGDKAKHHPKFRAAAQGLYDGEVLYVDAILGRLVHWLKEHRLYDQTTIVIISDHGEMMWDDGNYFGHGGPHLNDPLLHVPWIIKPAKALGLKPTRMTQPVSTRSLSPTLLELQGIDHGYDASLSLAPIIRGQSDAQIMPVLSENVKHGVLSMTEETGRIIAHKPRDLHFDTLKAGPTPKKVKALPTTMIRHIIQGTHSKVTVYHHCGKAPKKSAQGAYWFDAEWHIQRTHTDSSLLPVSFEAFRPEDMPCGERWNIDASAGHQRDQGQREHVDAEQMDALKAMGYIEE